MVSPVSHAPHDNSVFCPLGLGFLATYDPGCAARPGALVLDPFGVDCEREFADPLKLA
jgi:hypothetical protein